MAFSSANLAALVQGNGFTLWHYRTTDTRAAVTAGGYFAAAANRFRAGDLMMLQTADAVALVPVRTGPGLGTGVTLDGAVGPLNTVRAEMQGFSVTQVAAPVVRTIILEPFASIILEGGTIAVSASVAGPVAAVVFSLRDGSGAVLPPARTVGVAGGMAAASFDAPPIGSGYRIRVEDAADPSLTVTSSSFNVGPDLKLLLLEDNGRLLTEAGDILQQ